MNKFGSERKASVIGSVVKQHRSVTDQLKCRDWLIHYAALVLIRGSFSLLRGILPGPITYIMMNQLPFLSAFTIIKGVSQLDYSSPAFIRLNLWKWGCSGIGTNIPDRRLLLLVCRRGILPTEWFIVRICFSNKLNPLNRVVYYIRENHLSSRPIDWTDPGHFLFYVER